MSNKGVYDNYDILECSLLDLALTYLQAQRKNITVYNLLNTCHRIMQWNEERGKSKDKKIIFKYDKIFVHKKYLEKFSSHR